MLCKLSFGNIRRSLRDYAIYFFTLVIGVSVFYVFNAISGQAAMLAVTESRNETVSLLKTVLSGTSIFVAGVLGLLIVYASRFLMKRRNREFALYMTLGMGKGRISAILLLETVIIGIGSLGVGLLLGIGLSQIMSALVANLFEADMSMFRFHISGEAVGRTMLCFTVMYLVAVLFNSAVVSRMKLIDLMQSGRKSEQIRLKNPVACAIMFLIAAAALGIAYYEAGWKFAAMSRNKLVLCIAVGCAATYLLFRSVSGMLLRVVMSAKSVYHRGLNAFTFRQISSKINTAVLSMTVICLMLFLTICALSAAFSIRNVLNANLKSLCPADFALKWTAYEVRDEVHQQVYDDAEQRFAACGLDLRGNVREAVHFHSYLDPGVTMGSSFGTLREELEQANPFLMTDAWEEIFRLSDYNRLMQLYGRETLSLNADEYAVVCNSDLMRGIRSRALEAGTVIRFFGHPLRPHAAVCTDGFVEPMGQRLNEGFFVVPDSAVSEESAAADYFIGQYASEDQAEIAQFNKTLAEHCTKVQEATALRIAPNLRTKQQIGEESITLIVVSTFLGLYIGLVFLISCGAILALKELSESADSVGRYEMLRKLGAEEREITRSLFRQTGVFFLLPLLLACIHAVIGIRFASHILEALGRQRLGAPVFAAAAIIILIYGGYFAVTFVCGKSIIRGRK
ncbi:MAG: FtsX-like permease family protein [Oscillospiraceae bacterium]|nr:FtsX-like permease family protein [Oscillospiraceae bacterium]